MIVELKKLESFRFQLKKNETKLHAKYTQCKLSHIKTIVKYYYHSVCYKKMFKT